uniref:Ovule protein n=1 Tax=Gongylonema pulchrum TaxID=637853 RepID=A0A183ESY5_9BILA
LLRQCTSSLCLMDIKKKTRIPFQRLSETSISAQSAKMSTNDGARQLMTMRSTQNGSVKLARKWRICRIWSLLKASPLKALTIRKRSTFTPSVP